MTSAAQLQHSNNRPNKQLAAAHHVGSKVYIYIYIQLLVEYVDYIKLDHSLTAANS